MGAGESAAPEPDALADDPLARWRFLVARREAVIGAIRARQGDPGDYWTARAATMGPTMRVDPAATPPPLDLLLPHVDGATSVLDVGAGWGRFAIPLAHVARAVTAVEPSAALLAHLRANAEAAGLAEDRLRVVAANWEAATVPPAEVVLCANVLTPLADVGPFLRKLDAHTLRRGAIVLRAVAMDGPLVALWRAIHGVPYPRETDHTDALAALHALGIPARLDLAPSPGPIWAFASPDDARAFARQRLWLGAPGHDPRADALLDDWLAVTLTRDGDRWRVPAPEPQQALLWWER
jgi:SAM-dependent methyltransferase